MAFYNPRFLIDVQYIEGPGSRPKSVTIRPIFTTMENRTTHQILQEVGDLLRYQVRTVVRMFNGWSDAMIDNRVFGYLQMNNLHDPRHGHLNDIYVSELNPQSTTLLWENATVGYNTDLQVFQVEWMYYFTSTSLMIGGGGNTKQYQGLYPMTCISYPEISCAAAAIIFWFIKQGKYGESMKHNIRRETNKNKWLDLAKNLQATLGWSKEITVAQVQQALSQFPDHRIVVIQPTLKSSQVSDYEGIDYVLNHDEKIIYLYYDHINQHFSTVSAPTSFIRNYRNSSTYRWCLYCSSYFDTVTKDSCGCDGTAPKRGYKRKRPCDHCQELIMDPKRHQCFMKQCIVCKQFYGQGQEILDHRCPININIDTIPIDFESGDEKARQLWVYDIESCIILESMDGDQDFLVDENGHHYYDEEGEIPKCYYVNKYLQIPNLIIYQNVFTGELRKTASMQTFLRDMMEINKGNNIVLAHNASGYDSRLVFEELLRLTGSENEISTVMRGGKFMRIAINKTVFQDTMLHLVGSLKSLAKDFLKDHPVQLVKGYFPHLFNKRENYHYEGSIPPREDFDLSFSFSSDSDLKEFNEWYDTWKDRTDWNFQHELELYCENDVRVLSEIVKKHHHLCRTTLGNYREQLAISPWHYPTAAGYVHKLFLYDNEFQEMGSTQEENDWRAKNSWAVLQPEEYYFARQALRGGRTEIRKFYHKGFIRDQDIQSEYPYCQLTKSMEVVNKTIEVLYPVGYPTIEIHDNSYFPCNLHNASLSSCSCPLRKRLDYLNKKLKVKSVACENLHEYINNFFGFITVDATPPTNLYHPVLPTFDKDKQKCLFSLLPIKEQTFCSPELQLAIRMGYIVTRIYRADRYQARPSKWGMLKELYKLKLYNSQLPEPNDQNIFNETPEQWQARQYDHYKEKFNLELSFENWGKRPAAKKTGKILCNSGWGKHAETVDHIQTKILHDENFEDGHMFFQSLEESTNKLLRIQSLDNGQTIFKYTKVREKVKPNLHKAYLPCAVMVPMYGRMMLYNQIEKLGERVLMVDTDSVKYIDDPNSYEIPKGDCLGDWEEESLDRTNEFVAIGPKSYGQKTESGATSFKCKGVCIKRCHKNMINFEIAKDILMNGHTASIAQMTFDYQVGKGISRRGYIKDISFQEHHLKGNYNKDNYQLYPFGYKI